MGGLERRPVALISRDMPFTLAHPAAVLPFRRLSPRWLNVPGLVAGSVSPDLWYICHRLDWDALAHALRGTLILDLTAGLALLALFYGLRSPLVRCLPAAGQKALEPLCQTPGCSVFTAVVSVVLGVWSHLVLDGMTHKDGWLVTSVPLLQAPIWSVGYRSFRVFHLLWYGFSFVGIVWVYLAFEKWRLAAGAPSKATQMKWGQALSMAAIVVPFEVLHHVIPVLWLNLTVGAVTAAAMAVLLWRDWRSSWT